MAVIPFPPEIQDCFLIASFTEQAIPTTIRSTVDVGFPKVRRRYTKAFYAVTGAINVNQEQLQILNDWFDFDLEGGVNRFLFANPTTGDTREYRLVSPYTVTPLTDKLWTIGMELERTT